MITNYFSFYKYILIEGFLFKARAIAIETFNNNESFETPKTVRKKINFIRQVKAKKWIIWSSLNRTQTIGGLANPTHLLPPTSPQYFLLKTLENQARGIKTSDPIGVYLIPSPNDLERKQKWFLENTDKFVGAESGIPISFLADAWNMSSFDRGESAMDANKFGQEWIVDTFFWNRYPKPSLLLFHFN